jgi:hypothetical protein
LFSHFDFGRIVLGHGCPLPIRQSLSPVYLCFVALSTSDMPSHFLARLPDMMRFFRLILRLMFIFATTVLGVRLLTGTPLPTPLTVVMSGPDGVACDPSCLFGIRPGVTSLEQAVLILHAHPLTRDAKWINDHTLRLTGPLAYVSFSPTRNGLVDSISLIDTLTSTGIPVPGSLADSVTLGDLILAFGVPKIGRPDSSYFVLEYPAAGIVAASARPDAFQTRVQIGTPLSLLMVTVYRPCPGEASIFILKQWMGFTTLGRYWNSHRIYRSRARASGVSMPPFSACQP